MDTLVKLLNQLIERGIIKNYAIGGATALIYYCEPVQTQDIDVFVLIQSQIADLINLSPLYEFFQKKGFEAHKEHILINKIPVQFLVPYNDLLTEAVGEAVDVKYGNVKTKILSLEYLMAIMVQTGRIKDKARLEYLISRRIDFNKSALNAILKRNQLLEKWKKTKMELGL